MIRNLVLLTSLAPLLTTGCGPKLVPFNAQEEPAVITIHDFRSVLPGELKSPAETATRKRSRHHMELQYRFKDAASGVEVASTTFLCDDTRMCEGLLDMTTGALDLVLRWKGAAWEKVEVPLNWADRAEIYSWTKDGEVIGQQFQLLEGTTALSVAASGIRFADPADFFAAIKPRFARPFRYTTAEDLDVAIVHRVAVDDPDLFAGCERRTDRSQGAIFLTCDGAVIGTHVQAINVPGRSRPYAKGYETSRFAVGVREGFGGCPGQDWCDDARKAQERYPLRRTRFLVGDQEFWGRSFSWDHPEGESPHLSGFIVTGPDLGTDHFSISDCMIRDPGHVDQLDRCLPRLAYILEKGLPPASACETGGTPASAPR